MKGWTPMHIYLDILRFDLRLSDLTHDIPRSAEMASKELQPVPKAGCCPPLKKLVWSDSKPVFFLKRSTNSANIGSL